MSLHRVPIQLLLFEQETVSVDWVAQRLKTSDMSVRRLLETGALRGYQRTPGGWWNIFLKSVIEYEERLRIQYASGVELEQK